MFGDVVLATAIELDEDVIEWMLDYSFDILPDKLDRWAVVEQRQSVIGWMTVDGHAAVTAKVTLHADKSWDRASLMIHCLPPDFIVEI